MTHQNTTYHEGSGSQTFGDQSTGPDRYSRYYDDFVVPQTARSANPAYVDDEVMASGFRHELKSTSKVAADKVKAKATDLAGRAKTNALNTVESVEEKTKGAIKAGVQMCKKMPEHIEALPGKAKATYDQVSTASVTAYKAVCAETRTGWLRTADARRETGNIAETGMRALGGLARYLSEHYGDVQAGLGKRSDGQPHTRNCKERCAR